MQRRSAEAEQEPRRWRAGRGRLKGRDSGAARAAVGKAHAELQPAAAVVGAAGCHLGTCRCWSTRPGGAFAGRPRDPRAGRPRSGAGTSPRDAQRGAWLLPQPAEAPPAGVTFARRPPAAGLCSRAGACFSPGGSRWVGQELLPISRGLARCIATRGIKNGGQATSSMYIRAPSYLASGQGRRRWLTPLLLAARAAASKPQDPPPAAPLAQTRGE